MKQTVFTILALCLILTGCGGKKTLPDAGDVAFNDSVPSIDSLPEQALMEMDSVLLKRTIAGDTVPGAADPLKDALPVTLQGYGEAEMREAQMIESGEGRMAMASALFFDEEDHFLEMKLYDLTANRMLVKALADSYKAADGTEIGGGFYQRIPLKEAGMFAFVSGGGENASATCVVHYRYQLTLETDAKCDAGCFADVIGQVKWGGLKQ